MCHGFVERKRDIIVVLRRIGRCLRVVRQRSACVVVLTPRHPERERERSSMRMEKVGRVYFLLTSSLIYSFDLKNVRNKNEK